MSLINADEIKIGDELSDPEAGIPSIIVVGKYPDHFECIAFNGSDFDTFTVRKNELSDYEKTGGNFPQIGEMLTQISEWDVFYD